MVAPASLDEQLPFSSDLSMNVRLLLEEARRSCSDREKTFNLLEQAHMLAPDQLEVYYRYYKYLFYNKKLQQAEIIARKGLAEAGRQAGISADCLSLTPSTVDWNNSQGVLRFYLFTMKALAFILLRQERLTESENILAKLAELEPQDMLGSSVIRQLAMSLRDTLDAA